MHRFSILIIAAAAASLLAIAPCAPAQADLTQDRVTDPAFLTVAERSGFTATATSFDVAELIERLHEWSPYVTTFDMGRTAKNRTIPVMALSEPPVLSASHIPDDDQRLVVLVLGSIHGGEVCGKEAMMMLARDIALDPDKEAHRSILRNCILLLAPVYNLDGNDRMAPDNRPGQLGPEKGMGTRHTSEGLDLNRDYIKLAAPESRSLSDFFNEWNPHLTIDTHTTNGSHHRFTLTYAPPQNPAGHGAPIRFVRDDMLPAVSESLEQRTGYRTFFYGNFNNDMTEWHTYSHLPRFGAPYRGLRNRLSILSEAYAYAPYKDRVLCTYEFTAECLRYAIEHKETIHQVLDMAERDARNLSPRTVGIRYERAPFDEPATIPGWEMEENDEGELVPTGTPRDYTVEHFARFEPTLSVRKPVGYIIAPGYDHVAEKLRQHGIDVQRLPANREMHVEIYTIDELERAEREYQGVRQVRIEATPKRETRRVSRQHLFVPAYQPLGNLVVYLLEPESDDGLATWDLVDPTLEPGEQWPIWRAVE